VCSRGRGGRQEGRKGRGGEIEVVGREEEERGERRSCTGRGDEEEKSSWGQMGRMTSKVMRRRVECGLESDLTLDRNLDTLTLGYYGKRKGGERGDH
jgi:hypothetical protein